MKISKSRRTFAVSELGTVKRSTKGSLILFWPDGGDFPWDKDFPLF
ncbi:MAG: hypothetical protein ABW106_13110 [Steroidobacteraceae bacterium]